MKNDFKACGIDLVPVDTFFNLVKRYQQKSWKSYFTCRELKYCFHKSNPETHLAVRFAAKEAIIKAFSQLNIFLRFNEIEILKTKTKTPFASICLNQCKNYKVLISLTHTSTTAGAIVLVRKL